MNGLCSLLRDFLLKANTLPCVQISLNAQKFPIQEDHQHSLVVCLDSFYFARLYCVCRRNDNLQITFSMFDDHYVPSCFAAIVHNRMIVVRPQQAELKTKHSNELAGRVFPKSPNAKSSGARSSFYLISSMISTVTPS